MNNDTRLEELLHKYSENAMDEAEYEELFSMLSMDENENKVKEKLEQELLVSEFSYLDKGKLDKMLKNVMEVIQPLQSAPIRRMWYRIAAVAAVIIVLSVGTFLLYNAGENKKPVIVKQEPKREPNVLPGGDKATLTLADSTQIVLDSSVNGAISQQDGIKVINVNGQVTYTGHSKNLEVLYNTISTPKGGQYQLVLADGSKVWLNAASSLRFPTTFTGKERTVELTGEGYFEITHNEERPFHVTVNQMDVKVLGTHFNVMAYDDESAVKTTLLEGSVMVTKWSVTNKLSPGQQAILHPGQDNIKVTYDVDVNEVIAWKNGWFNFNSLEVPDIMRQISRWYDVDVNYEGKISGRHFTAIVSRNSKLSGVLRIMETAGIKFRIEGKKITVLK